MSAVSAPATADSADRAELEAAVRSERLTKRFGKQTAVDSIDLLVPTGAVYGFLGPNGSGKTTTIRMLLGLVAATSGRPILLGSPMPEGARTALPRVGALVEGPAFHPYLSGRRNLARLDAADPYADPRTATRRVDAALDRVGLLAAATKRFRAYSLGMRQRLAIAGALLQPRELLVLDEPTNGLDPQGTREVRHLVADLAGDGATVLISSHLLSEVEQICSHVGVMHAGKLLTQGTITEVRNRTAPSVRVVTTDPDPAMMILKRLGIGELDAVPVRGDQHRQTITGLLGEVDPASIIPALADRVTVYGFTVESPSLEDMFVQLTGEGFDVSG
ncbi:ABC transporter ATP-binding protein [Microlunatus soli]|uniref:ABC-2 type transport system ATP-binding protein n=1 Tax=Microlunatus soli TaxID=630515 RepID=A0A1H1WTH4_9ACTN|nr:ATP-binding cassette domain-containing protein [Microlunatus soli]SDT00362.1 ABC-2 type transport system ATP-binding protein [Microlunatus soli]